MDQLTFDIWSIGAVFIFAGTYTMMMLCHIFYVFNVMTRPDFSYVVEFGVAFEATECIASHLNISAHVTLGILTLGTYLASIFIWRKLSVKWKRWLRVGLIILGAILAIIWVLHAYFDVNALMALQLIWRRFIIPMFEQVVFFFRRMWLGALEYIAALTWKEGGLFAQKFVGQIVLRWVKRAVILFAFYQAIANRMRRVYMLDRVQKFKESLLVKKTSLVNFYKAMPFWQKLIFCISASVCVFFVSQSWDVIYPFVPKGALKKALGSLKWISTRLGINNLLDRITVFLLKILRYILPIMVYIYVERRWHLFINWRLRRYNIAIDRWIAFIDQKARNKARAARQVVIANFQRHQKEKVDIDGTW